MQFGSAYPVHTYYFFLFLLYSLYLLLSFHKVMILVLVIIKLFEFRCVFVPNGFGYFKESLEIKNTIKRRIICTPFERRKPFLYKNNKKKMLSFFILNRTLSEFKLCYIFYCPLQWIILLFLLSYHYVVVLIVCCKKVNRESFFDRVQ